MEFRRKAPEAKIEPRQFKISPENIKDWSSPATNDKLIFASIIYWLIGLTASMVLIIHFLPTIPYEIPLFFSRTFGPEQLSDRNQIYLLPLALFLMGSVNLVGSLKFHAPHKELSYLLTATTIIIVTLIFLALINVLRLAV